MSERELDASDLTRAMASRIGISFQSDKSIGEYRELARIVDRFDFATVSVYQDLFYQPPWPALLQFAELTSRPLIGPAVLNPYLCHPALDAAHLALVDDLSRGRAYLGVGRGAYLDKVDLPQPRPLRAMREMVELIQHLLAGDRTSYEGEIFHATSEAYLRFPIPARRLPVLIGGWGEQTVRLAGEIAGMLKVASTTNPDSAAFFRRHLDEGSRRAGRDAGSTRLVYGAVTVVDRDRRRAEAIARRKVATYVAVSGKRDPVYAPSEEEIGTIERAFARGDEQAAADALTEETLARHACFGTPEDVVRQIERLFDAGVDLFELGTPHGLNEAEAVELLGKEVLPYFEER